MRRILALVAAAGTLAACSSAPAPRVVESVQPRPAERSPAAVPIETSAPEPEVDPRCDEMAELAQDGDHKPAVDRFDELLDEGTECPLENEALAAQSRLALDLADELVLSSTAKKQAGDFDGAQADLEAALEVYPKYYWARKLLRDLGGPPPQEEVAEVHTPAAPSRQQRVSASEVHADVELLKQLIAEQNLQMARLAEQAGDLEAAQHWAIQAVRSEPDKPELRDGIVEYARLLGLKFFSAGELTPARELWGAALSIDGDDDRLQSYLRQVDERLQNLEEIRRKNGGR